MGDTERQIDELEEEAQYALECVLARLSEEELRRVFNDLPPRAREHVRLTAADYPGDAKRRDDGAGAGGAEAAERRAVPTFYPDFSDANKVRRWDGSRQAEAWASLMDFRDECISASAGHLAGMDFENIDHPGLLAFLWGIDEEEAAEVVRRRRLGA